MAEQDSLSVAKVIFLLAIALATIVISTALLQALYDDQDAKLIEFEEETLDLMQYYGSAAANRTDDFAVQSIALRVENNFLQGLYFDQSTRIMYESAGLYEKSHVQSLKVKNPETMALTKNEFRRRLEAQHPQLRTSPGNTPVLEPDKVAELTPEDFGEGLSPRSANEFIVLTWKERRIYTFDRTTLALLETYVLDDQITEGWGVTADESSINANGYYQLYVSDGSDQIYFMDGETLAVTKTIRVYDPVTNSFRDLLNELEFVGGFIYANIWYENLLVKIDPKNGAIVKQWDITSLELTETAFQKDFKVDGLYVGDTLNGVAYDASTDDFYLSGKKYHLIFKMKLNQ